MKLFYSNKLVIIYTIIFVIIYKIFLEGLSIITSFIVVEMNIDVFYDLIIYYSIVIFSVLILHYYVNHKVSNQKVIRNKYKIFLLIIFATILLKICFTVINYSDIIFNNQLLESPSNRPLHIYNVITTSIIIPIYEELFFRGILLKKIIKKNSIVFSILFVSILFTLAHTIKIINGTFGIKQLSIIFIASLLFSLIYVFTKNVSYSIVSHITFNISSDFIFSRMYFNDLLRYLSFGIIYWSVIVLTIIFFFFILKKLFFFRFHANFSRGNGKK